MLSVLVTGACTSGDGPSSTTTDPDTLSADLASLGLGATSAGIHVVGAGKTTVEPDVAKIGMGVESFAPTVAEARRVAAGALTSMLSSLRLSGVSESDAKTTYFSIQPEYNYVELVKNGRHVNERVLTGYRVTNALSVIVRDLDQVGEIIDGLAAAGGDATRINSIAFDVEDRTIAQEQARALALRDALSRAQTFADEMGVKRGKLLFVSEVNSSMPQVPRFAMERVAVDSAFAGAPTSILAGDLDVLVSVRAVFAID